MSKRGLEPITCAHLRETFQLRRRSHYTTPGLILRRRAHRVLHSQVRQEGVVLRLSHLGGVADMAEEDDPRHPVPVALLGPWAVVAGTKSVAEAAEELGLAIERWGTSRSENERRDI